MEPSRINSNSIEISVVIPVRNEEASVRNLLEGLLGQTLPANEIVITDSASTDATTQIIEEFIQSGAPVKLVRGGAGLPGRGRNISVAHSRCDWIAFTDAGITPASGWLAGLARKAKESSVVDVVYGTYEPIVDSFFKECATIAYVTPPFEEDGEFVRPPSIASALMRRRAWETAGGFPENLRSAEDLLFMRRVAQAGFKIVRTSEAIVYWNIQPNFRLTFRRFVAYACNNIRAGLFAEWQGRIFVYYAVIAASSFAVFFLGPVGLLVPPVIWLLFLIARATRALYRNRKSYPGDYTRNLARLCLIVPIIAVLDAATFLGSLIWLLQDKLGLMSAGEDNEPRK